ncbi:MAG TPA: peptide chain release factor-like protein [Candidatus Binatus sp.]|jgi:hypothetical protein|nr:peptide chain release factor-like protein [Candidatus Binatus sp.]
MRPYVESDAEWLSKRHRCHHCAMSEDFHLFVNGRVFHAEHGARELMTGAQIADLVGVPANRAVIRLDPKIDPKDLRVDTFCPPAFGNQPGTPGYIGVRVTHIPSGLIASYQDEKSQTKNRAAAMHTLRTQLYESGRAKQREIGANEVVNIESGDHFLVTAL